MKDTRKFKEIKNSKTYVLRVEKIKKVFHSILSPEDEGLTEVGTWVEANGEIHLGSIRKPNEKIKGLKIIVPRNFDKQFEED